MSKFTKETAEIFYAEHVGKEFFPRLQEFMCSDVCVGLELVGEGSIQKWREFIGPTNTQRAQQEAPNSIRALFGTDGTKNAVHGSDSQESAHREINFFFGGDPATRPMQTTAVMNNCSLCIVKPHILKECKAGEVIDMIL